MREKYIKTYIGKLKENNHSEDVRIDERIILKWILKKRGWVGMDWHPEACDKNK